MSTTEYVLDTHEPYPGPCAPDYGWLEHERDMVRIRQVRIRHVPPECETVWAGEARELARLFAESQAEIERLREELVECLDDAFRNIAHYVDCKTAPRAGWWDTMASSTARDFGDRLVELGVWERDPDGCGRRWFYRPIEKNQAAEAAKGEC